MLALSILRLSLDYAIKKASTGAVLPSLDFSDANNSQYFLMGWI